MPRKESHNRWSQRQNSDQYVKKRIAEGYPSRSAFKLREINRRDRVIRPGMRLIDLGASPGGWTQVASELIGEEGVLVAVDILTMNPIEGAIFIEGDCRDAQVKGAVRSALDDRPVSLVMSDMAPNITGVTPIDEAAACELAHLALDYAQDFLEQGGPLVMKLFQFTETESVIDRIAGLFTEVERRKPPASRAQSREFYVVAKRFGI